MRGQQSIFLSLFETSNSNDSYIAIPERKGRSEALHNKRVELLIHRYYYYIKIVGKQYAATLETLEQDEMFLSQRTIINTVQENSKLLRELRDAKPVLKYFKNKYPFMVW